MGQENPLEKGNGNPLQHSCLGNPMDRENWQAAVYRIKESDTTEATEHVSTQAAQGAPPSELSTETSR